jgi:hypothetical protein
MEPAETESTPAPLNIKGCGTRHKVDAKHLPAYLDEMCFRFNNRKNPFLFRDAIQRLIAFPNLEYRNLTAKVQDAA